MADSLVLTGVRQVTKHTGDEMVRLDYPRGGNTWQIKRWWVQGNGAVYEDCTVFKVTGGAGTGYLALLASPSVNVRIDHDGSFGFNFYQINELARAALYTENWELVEHYVMPRISGGKVMTVTPADAGTIGGGGGGGGGGGTTTGPAAGVTLVGTTSTAANGDVTGAATTGGTGSGLTVSYSVAGGTASALTIAAAGDGYTAGDSFQVVGDTGVTGTVSI